MWELSQINVVVGDLHDDLEKKSINIMFILIHKIANINDKMQSFKVSSRVSVNIPVRVGKRYWKVGERGFKKIGKGRKLGSYS